MIGGLLAITLTVVAVPDPGTSARGASAHVHFADANGRVDQRAAIGAGDRATFDVPPRVYDVDLTKPGFVPARRTVAVSANGAIVRIALHAVPGGALRTIGAVSAAERGAFNRSPDALALVPREAYRDQGQPGSASVLLQTPSLAVDRAARGFQMFDKPPVPLVRGGTPLETQILIDGNPVALPSTRTLALAAIPSFVLNEVEVYPGQSAALPAIDGALNGSINLRFADATPVWRALPELAFDSRGGGFADLAAGGASADHRLGVALVAVTNGAKGAFDAMDAVQRALLVKGRFALSPAASLGVTTYGEDGSDRFTRNTFSYSAADLRVTGSRDTVSARWWHAGAQRDGAVPSDPFEFRTDDALTGAAVELDHTGRAGLFSAGASETYGRGSAEGIVDVDPGATQRVQTAFLRAIVHPSRKLDAQLTYYEFRADTRANGRRIDEGGFAGRVGLAYRASDTTTVRASVGTGFTPPSLIALAGTGVLRGPEGSGTVDVGVEHRVFDRYTTLSADVFAAHGVNRVVERGLGQYATVDSVTRRGAEFSLARRAPSGLGFVLQAWTVAERPGLGVPAGDVASGATHGYAEISYHGIQGSRVSLGATYWGADVPFGAPAVVLLNSNIEIQVGARGKVQLSIENLNDVARGITTSPLRFVEPANAFAPGPRTVRLLLRRSFGRTGSDG